MNYKNAHFEGLAQLKRSNDADMIKKQRSIRSLVKEDNLRYSKNIDDKKDDLAHEHTFHLLDYRDDNKVLKKSVMNLREAYNKNKVLTGTGMAWSRVGGY